MTSDMTGLAEAREAWILEEEERYRIELALEHANDRITWDEFLRRNEAHAIRVTAAKRWIKRQRGISAAVRRDVLSAEACAYCGDYATAVDHVIPVSRGGTNDRANLTPACRPCNEEKLDFTPDEWRAWREETGRPWPPVARSEELGVLIRRCMTDEAARQGVTVEELFEQKG